MPVQYFWIYIINIFSFFLSFSLYRLRLRGPYRSGASRFSYGKTRWLLDSSWILISKFFEIILKKTIKHFEECVKYFLFLFLSIQKISSGTKKNTRMQLKKNSLKENKNYFLVLLYDQKIWKKFPHSDKHLKIVARKNSPQNQFENICLLCVVSSIERSAKALRNLQKTKNLIFSLIIIYLIILFSFCFFLIK